jgi:hypothetical protein
MIPSKLRYGTKAESAPARSYKTNVQPQNGTTYNNASGAQLYFNIPTRSNLFMASTENYLRFDFDLKNTSGNNATARWDSCGAHGLIQRIRVFHGSNLLEDIDNYGLLSKMLFDTQVHTDSTYGKMNILAGTRNDLNVNIPAATTFTSAVNLSATQINSGEELVNSSNSASLIPSNSSTLKRTYCLNLISIVGSLCADKYFPLFACTSAPLKLEIWLVDDIKKAMNFNGTAEFNLTNVEFVTNMIEVSDDVMGIINNSLEGNPLQFVVPSYRNYSWSGYTLANNSGTQNINVPVNAKFSSVRSIFVCMRDKPLGSANSFPFSCVSLDFKDYYFRVGSLIMPPKYPYSTTEAFAELMKAIGSISDLNHTPSIELASYTMKQSLTTDNPIKSSTNSGSFYIGLDLENYVGANKDAIFAGYNTNTDDIYFVYDVENTSGAAVNPRFDSYALYDSLLVFQNGTVFAKF